ncbi:MAG TPA: hypothetical protein VG389_03755, partial [Myxococcota bacterium]|nr:hypothetical protein [Myxococcota bacterium]
MLTWLFERFEAVLTRDATRAEVLAEAGVADDRPAAVVLAARGPKRCVLQDESPDGTAPDGTWIDGLLAPQTFYQGDVVRFPPPIGRSGGESPVEPPWSPRRKFQHFLNLAKFSFFHVRGGAPDAIGTKYGALGNPSPPPCTVEVRPAHVDAAGSEVELTILQDGDPLDGVEVRVRPDPAEQGTQRWWNGEGRARRHFPRVTNEEGTVTCFLAPAAGATSMRVRVRVDGLGRPTHVTIPVGTAPAAVSEDDDALDPGDAEAGVTCTEQAWRMPLGWNPRARPASPAWFATTRTLTFPDPPTHAWACSPLTAMFFGYWYNANRSTRNDYVSSAPAGFGDYFTPVRWDRDYPNIPAAADRDALLARFTNRPVAEAQMSVAGQRFAAHHIPALYLAEQDRWKWMLEEVNFYKRFPRAHAMMLVKVAGPDTPPEVSRIHVVNPLTGEPFPEGLYQFSSDGQWFQGNYFHSRVAFEFAAPQIEGLPDPPLSIRYFSCGPTHFVRLLPAPRPEEADSPFVMHPGEEQQSEDRERRRHARRAARSGATAEPVFDPTGPWSDWSKSLLQIWRGLRIGEDGRP